MQTGQRRVDDGEDVLEIVVGAVVGVLDVGGVRTRSRIERPQHPDPVGVDAQIPQYPEVVAAQRDHQIRRQMIVVELGGPVIGRIAVRGEHVLGPPVGALAGMPATRCPHW